MRTGIFSGVLSTDATSLSDIDRPGAFSPAFIAVRPRFFSFSCQPKGPLAAGAHFGGPYPDRKVSTLSSPSRQFHKIWIEQCAATEGIREHFGLEDALDYLIGEKLFNFVMAAEQNPEFAAELPTFVAEIRRLFAAEEIRDYLDHLEHTKFLAPPEPDLERDDLDDETEEEPWLENPILGAEELLRFSRIRQLLQP
jgi:hypothetical protein